MMSAETFVIPPDHFDRLSQPVKQLEPEPITLPVLGLTLAVDTFKAKLADSETKAHDVLCGFFDYYGIKLNWEAK